MREIVYVAPGANGTELIKCLAMQGINCINVRICGAGELARMALMRSGISISDDFVSAAEETAIIADAIKGVKYFEKATYSDIQDLASAVRKMRSLVDSDIEDGEIERILSQGIFREKNDALISVYKNYKRIITDRKLIDFVSLMRKAIAECSPIDADFFTLKEYPLNPLGLSLLKKLSGGNWKEVTLSDLFEIKETPLRINSIKNCYGAPNEVETILAEIYTGKKLDQCTVAVTDPGTYGQLFFDYALLYDIPITFGCGIPIINSNPARLLALYHRWMTGGFFGAYSIKELLTSKAFDAQKLRDLYPDIVENFRWDTYMDILGEIRFTNNGTVNKKRLEEYKVATAGKEDKSLYIPYLEVIGRELALPPEVFISKYSYIRKESDTNATKLLTLLDTAAVRAIYDELEVIRESGIEQASEDMILSVLKMNVATGTSEEGKLYVAGTDGALSSIRPNIYIAGLSASKYPGSPRENYLLLDADLRLFGDKAEYMTSEGIICRKRERLLTLARLASGLGSTINISYAGLNVSELKKDNASSLVFELYREENGRNATSNDLEKHITKVDYFEPSISVTRKVGEAYNEGKSVIPRPTNNLKNIVNVHLNLDKEYSPSALENYFGCPRAFMIGRILGIPEPEDDKPFEVIAATEGGTLAHSLMEELGNSDMSLEDFLKLSGEYFDRFLAEHPPLVDQNAEAEKEQFLDMMETAYNMDPHREVVLEEEDIHCVHETGVKLHGFPDRVEKLDDGSYLVVDFKTGRTLSHEQDDINTCLQIVIYSYLLEQKGYKIAGGEYRYIRLNEIVTCRYDKEIKDQLKSKLYDFKKHMETADFPIPSLAISRTDDDPDPCVFCKFGMICGKNNETGGSGYEWID